MKRLHRRILSFLLALMMLTAVIPFSALEVFAENVELAPAGATSGTTGDCTWTIEEAVSDNPLEPPAFGKVLTISGNGAMADYDDGSWGECAPWSPSGNNSDYFIITKVVISDGVTNIGENAFSDCDEITNVSIGASVTSIGYRAFTRCHNLISITIPDSVTSIGQEAFDSCERLTSVSIGASVTSIGSSAFSGCQNLASVTIPDSVTSIGSWAFRNCTNFTNINIPNSVTSIDSTSFNGCSNLKSITVSEANSVYASINGNLYNKEKTRFMTYAAGKSDVSFTIPSSVTIIDYAAFDSCTNLISINIPNSVTSIGATAFGECTCLESVIIPDSVTSVGSNAFYSCINLTSVTISNSVTNIDMGVFNECTSLTSVTIPNSVTKISYYAFEGCTNLTTVTIPDSVTKIDMYAFKNCPNLININYCGDRTKWDKIIFQRDADKSDLESRNLVFNASASQISSKEKYEYIAKYYPRYLDNSPYNNYRNVALSICNDALQHNDKSSSNFLKAYAEGFVNGDKILIKELFSRLGVGQSTQDEWLEENTLDFISEISSSENYIASKYDKIAKKYKDFKTTVKAVDLADTAVYAAKKAAFIKELSDKSSVLDKAQVEELADKLFEKKSGIKFFDLVDYAVDVADILSLSLQMLDVEESVLQDVMNNIDTDSTLYKGLSKNLVSMRNDPVDWVIKKYFDSMVLDKMVDFLGEIKNGFLSLTNGGLETSLTLKVVSTISSILYKYVWKYSKIDDINGAIQAYDFLTTIRVAKQTRLNQIFSSYNNGTVPSDALLDAYSDMFCVEESAMKHYAKTCKKLEEKNSNPIYLSSLEDFCDTLDNIYSFDNYIDCCYQELKNGVSNGEVTCNHGLNHKLKTVSPTCMAGGYDALACEVCGYSWNTNYTSALGHSYNNTVISPSCTAQGYTRHTCTRCSSSYNDTYVSALGHNYTNTVVPATCTARGYTTHTCTRCSNSYTDAYVSALGHNYNNTVVPPTCTARGYTTHTCTRCSSSYTDSYVNATGHHAGSTVVVDLPSVDQDGWSETRCADCGRLIQEDAIPYLAISEAAISENAPYTLTYRLPKATAQSGYTDYQITMSSATTEKTVSDYVADSDSLVFAFDNLTRDDLSGLVTAVLSAKLYDTDFTSEAFVSAFALPPEQLLGDVDGDGEVTSIDATLIQRYLAGIRNLSDKQIKAADIDGDGVATILDTTLIQRYLAGIIVKYPINEYV